jgi:penicillin-binding protein 2
MNVRVQPLKDHWKEQRLFLSRVIAAGVIVVGLTGVLIWRLVHLQVVDYQRFSGMSEDNQIKIQPLPPTRGLIYDRAGRALAENIPAWQLVAVPEQIEDLDAVLGELEELGLLDPANREVLKNLVRSRRQFEPVTLTNLDEEQAARFAVRRHHFSGIDVQEGLIRYYPYEEAAAHAVGYVGSISAADFEQIDRSDYTGTSQIGKTGVERAYEEQLHGTRGYRPRVVNAQGREIPDWSLSSDDRFKELLPVPGNHVHLGLDISLQLAALDALEGVRGAAVAIDPRNGDVLTLISTPAFDPNNFANGLSGAEYTELTTNSDRPLFNRALAGRYPPGSTVKPFYGLAGLHFETEHVAEDHFCNGEFQLPGNSRIYGEGQRILPHGETTLHSAIVRSCNVYFYGLAVELGIDRMEQFMKSFGFGARTGIDISGESAALMPGRQWKSENFSTRELRAWYPGETVSTGIGQGFTEVTPLQLAHATATMAASGLRYRPRLLVKSENAETGIESSVPVDPLEPIDDVDPAHWQIIHDAMNGVTTEQRGTGLSSMGDAWYSVSGKTGTAQVRSYAEDEQRDLEEVEEQFRDNGLFIAYAPAENPEIAIAVVVENNGGGSRTAAPVARKVLDAYFGTRDYVAQLVTF